MFTYSFSITSFSSDIIFTAFFLEKDQDQSVELYSRLKMVPACLELKHLSGSEGSANLIPCNLSIGHVEVVHYRLFQAEPKNIIKLL